jgi:hypothetical protein
MLLYVNYGNNSHPSIIELANTLHNTYFSIVQFFGFYSYAQTFKYLGLLVCEATQHYVCELAYVSTKL